MRFNLFLFCLISLLRGTMLLAQTAPSWVVDAGESLYICPDESLELAALGAGIYLDSVFVAEGHWASNGGVFSPDATFEYAQTFTPDSVQTANGRAVLRLYNADSSVYDEVTVYIARDLPFTCHSIVRVYMPPTGCAVPLTPAMILANTPDEYSFYHIQIKNSSNQPLFPADTATENFIDASLKVTLKNICFGQSCTALLVVRDTASPAVLCPDFSVSCLQTNLTPDFLADSLGIAAAKALAADNCTLSDISYSDIFQDQDCPSPVVSGNVTGQLVRTWTATDVSGNTASCVQHIGQIGLRANDVQLPANIGLPCVSPGIVPPERSGRPTFSYAYPVGVRHYPLWPSPVGCDIQVSYTDVVQSSCEGSYKLTRTWTITDGCLPESPYPPQINPVVSAQTIAVNDTVGPQIACPPGLTVSIPTESCCAAVDFPDVPIIDRCSRIQEISAELTVFDPVTGEENGAQEITGNAMGPILTNNPPGNLDTLGIFGAISCVPPGHHQVKYRATDFCGRLNTCTFILTVTDTVPPVAHCRPVVSAFLGADGSAVMPATQLDNQSTDLCGTLFFKVRSRLRTCQDTTKFYDQALLCCQLTGDTLPVILRVYDMPPPAGAVKADTLIGHFTDCVSNIVLRDTVRPVCVVPTDITTECVFFDQSFESYPFPELSDNDACCDLDIDSLVDYSHFDTLCRSGSLIRRWTVTDCAGNSASCEQKITTNYKQYFYIRFPADREVFNCSTDSVSFGEIAFYHRGCEKMDVTHQDTLLYGNGCVKYERLWRVKNVCSYAPGDTCIRVPNPDVLTGPVLSESGTPIPGWSPSSLLVSGVAFNYGGGPTPAPIALTGGWNVAATCYEYRQTATFKDTIAPVITEITGDSLYADTTTNDPAYWNAPGWWSIDAGHQNMAEAAVDFSISFRDDCILNRATPRCELFCDLNGDGVPDTRIDVGTNISAPNTVLYNNINASGTIRTFDHRTVSANEKWGWGLAVDTLPDGLYRASLCWRNAIGQDTLPQLPYGGYHLKWTISDACGNNAVHQDTFEIYDGRAPQIFCPLDTILTQLSLLQTGNPFPDSLIVLEVEDNYLPADRLIYAMYWPDTLQSAVISGVTGFDCDARGFQTARIRVSDREGNATACYVHLLVDDFYNECGDTSLLSVAGNIRTASNLNVPDISVQLIRPVSAGSQVNIQRTTNALGRYAFPDLMSQHNEGVLKPSKNSGWLDGVSVWDLVLISRHILGIQPFDSPYKLIAADANHSGTITSFDIVELRKLLLGTYTQLPNNTSWRFIDAGQIFSQPENPFADSIRETIMVHHLTADMTNANFVGVKIGDTDVSIMPQIAAAPDDRTSPMRITVEDRPIYAGETITVTLSIPAIVHAIQLTLSTGDMEIEQTGGLPEEYWALTSDAVALACEHHLTAPLAVQVKALRSGWLSDFLRITNEITTSRAFDINGTSYPIELHFVSGKNAARPGFYLYPNQPNPFAADTRIWFEVPQDEYATLTVFDVNGKTLYSVTQWSSKGRHEIALNAAELNQYRGVLYYRLVSESGSQTRSMIRN